MIHYFLVYMYAYRWGSGYYSDTFLAQPHQLSLLLQ